MLAPKERTKAAYWEAATANNVMRTKGNGTMVGENFPCPYCNLVYYGKGALTRHINEEHWNEKWVLLTSAYIVNMIRAASAAPSKKKTMGRRICILGDVRYVLGLADGVDVYKIQASDGLPAADAEPVHHDPKEADCEFWRCNNCGQQFPNWEQTRPHLGKFHDLIDPFNYPE
jgi:hypothetical protein